MYFAELKLNYLEKWWYYASRALLFILFGIAALRWPRTAAGLAVTLVAVGLILDGIVLLLPTVLGKATRHLNRIVLTKGILEIGVGLIALANGYLSITIFTVAIGLLLIFRGILETITFVETQAQVRHQRLALLSVLIAVALGMILVTAPFRERFGVGWTVGAYALVIGVMNLFTAWRLSERLRDDRATTTLISRLEPADLVQRVREQRRGLRRRKRGETTHHTVPRQTRDFMELPYTKYTRPLICTPHPDDLEGFVGGLVYRMQAPVTSVIYAGGNLGVWRKEFARMEPEDYIAVRLDESVAAGRILGIEEIIYLGYRDREVVCDEEMVEKTLAIFREYQPDLVVSFEYFKRATPYTHPDHLATGCAVRQAIARYEHRRHLDYLVTSTLLPNRFVDISDVRRVKLEALACHRTQSGVNAAIFPFFEKMLVRLWGAFTGVQYAEGYRLVDIDRMKARLEQG
ncbi:MAG: hypothetical protein GYB66_15625 [Chloroflexi bacterium]|nr:hypothetical protein [Chloroflexota bacterium]